MTRIALLIQEKPRLEDDNYFRFARALDQIGHEITLISIDSLALHAGRVTGHGFAWTGSLAPGQVFPRVLAREIDHELVWVLSIGERSTFLDKFQLLYAISNNCMVINSLDAIMHLKSKYYLTTQSGIFPSPETHASSNVRELLSVIQEKGGKWIIKPPAGSLGRDVFLVDEDDSNAAAILQHLCGPEETGYAMIQRYVPEIEAGEKRVLIAGGEVIDQYRRYSTGDHRTNVSQGARTEHCQLNEAEQTLCNLLARELANRGVFFAGIDLAFPWLIEVNVINPGGIGTINELTGVDHATRVVNAVLRQANLED